MPAGRPFKFTPDELKTRVDSYLQGDRVTLAGLAYYLGIDRQTLYNYAERDEFFDIIKGAREAVEAKYEERLIYGATPTGVIFALKNMGWSDKQEIKHEGIAIPFFNLDPLTDDPANHGTAEDSKP